MLFFIAVLTFLLSSGCNAQVHSAPNHFKTGSENNEALQQRELDQLEAGFAEGCHAMNKPGRNIIVGTLLIAPFILSLSLMCPEEFSPLLRGTVGSLGVVSFYKAFRDNEIEATRDKLPLIYNHFKAVQYNLKSKKLDTVERGKALSFKIDEALAECEKKYKALQKAA